MFKIANIPGERRTITGQELDSIPDEELDEVVLNTNIFGRMKPENKEKVIEVLKRNRRYVAMIGDGVNDVKPIKSAQVGVALESGSGAARGVADMILVNDNFSALPKALVEGRRTVSGIRDILKIYLSRNFVLAIMFIAIFFFAGTIPMLPIQNTFYAFTAVTIISFFMTLFAKPDENKELILPDVIRFCIPSAIIIGSFSLIIYALGWILADNGTFVWDPSYLESQTEFYGRTVDEIIRDLLCWDEPDVREMMARNCMVLFASVTGALQLLIVCPRYKFLSVDGNTNKRIIPIILVLLVLGAITAMYTMFPEIATFAGMIVMPKEAFLLVITMCIIAFFAILFFVKRKLLGRIVSRFEEWYLKRLDKEYTKGDVVNMDSSFRKKE